MQEGHNREGGKKFGIEQDADNSALEGGEWYVLAILAFFVFSLLAFLVIIMARQLPKNLFRELVHQT